MSLDSKKEAEEQLVERYGETWGMSHPAFRAGEGVSWKRLKIDVDREVEAEQAPKPGQLIRPWTSAEAAGLLSMNQKVFRVLATMDSATGPLLQDDGKHASISIARLLKWAEGVPKVRRWREFRRDEDLLGVQTVKSAEATFKMVRGARIDLNLIAGKVTSLDLSHLSLEELDALRELLRGGSSAIQLDERNVAMLVPSTLPKALGMPWEDEALKQEYVSRYRGLLEEAREESSQRLAVASAQISSASAEDGVGEAQEALDALVAAWREEERELAHLQSEIRSELLNLTLPPAVPGKRVPFRF